MQSSLSNKLFEHTFLFISELSLIKERKIEIVLYEEIHKKQYENLLIKNQKETSHSKLNTIDLLNTELFNKTRFIGKT